MMSSKYIYVSWKGKHTARRKVSRAGAKLSRAGVRQEIDEGPYLFVTQRTAVSVIPSRHRGSPYAVSHSVDKRASFYSLHRLHRRRAHVLAMAHNAVRDKQLSPPFTAPPLNMAPTARRIENLPGPVFFHMNGVFHIHADGQCRHRPRRVVRIHLNCLRYIPHLPLYLHRYGYLPLFPRTEPA